MWLLDGESVGSQGESAFLFSPPLPPFRLKCGSEFQPVPLFSGNSWVDLSGSFNYYFHIDSLEPQECAFNTHWIFNFINEWLLILWPFWVLLFIHTRLSRVSEQSVLLHWLHAPELPSKRKRFSFLLSFPFLSLQSLISPLTLLAAFSPIFLLFSLSRNNLRYYFK